MIHDYWNTDTLWRAFRIFRNKISLKYRFRGLFYDRGLDIILLSYHISNSFQVTNIKTENTDLKKKLSEYKSDLVQKDTEIRAFNNSDKVCYLKWMLNSIPMINIIISFLIKRLLCFLGIKNMRILNLLCS